MHSDPFAASQGLEAAGDLSRLTRLVLRLDRVLADEGSAHKPPGSAVALFEVWAEPIQLQVS